MGFFDLLGKLFSGGEISLTKNLLTEDRQDYIGEWRGAITSLLIKPDGTIEYMRRHTVGDTTNTDTVSGPINGFDGASFTVGVLGNNTRFEVSEPPWPSDGGGGMIMNVNGDLLEKV